MHALHVFLEGSHTGDDVIAHSSFVLLALTVFYCGFPR
jgi:hypothetical protein